MQELFVDKIHFFKFLSVSDKLQLHQLKIITSTAAVQASVTVRISPARTWKYQGREISCVDNKYKASPTYQAR